MRRFTVFLMALILVTGCANFDNASRSLAAQRSYQELMQNHRYNVAFNEIFSDEDATKRYLDFFTRLGRMYYRNQALIGEFDAQLEQGKDPLKSDLYQEIWVARDLKDHLEDKMVFHILKLREVEQSASDEDAYKARIILGSLARILDGMQEHEKVPFIDVLTKVNSYKESMPASNKKSSFRDRSLNELVSPFHDFMKADFDWEDFYEENGAKIEAETKKRAGSKKFYQELEKAGDSSRTPNSVLVYPTSGKEGNMFGHRLPKGTWAITYDDGPRTATTSKIMDLLDDANIKATFFWLAQNAERYPDMVRLGLRLGMDLANHSYSHANVPKLSRSKMQHEILESTDTLESLYGHKVKFFRLPYGAGVNSSEIRKMIADRGMIHVYWSVDSLDWQDKNPRSIFNRVRKQMENDGRGIILFHDIHSQTVETTKLMIDYAEDQKRMGNRLDFKSMTEVVAELNGESTPSLPRTPAPAGTYRVKTDLNVRMGFTSSSARCAVLPQGTYVKVIERRGSYARIQAVNTDYGLTRDLANCRGQTMVHADYLEAP